MSTRDASPTSEIKAIPELQPVPSTELEWLVARRVGRMPAREGPGALLIRLRDEGKR